MHVKDLLDITGRIAVVTGGAGRYGRSIVDGLLEAGSRVIIASRNLDSLNKTKKEFNRKGYDSVFCYRYDQGDLQSVDALVRDVYRDHKRIDVLINNAVYMPMRSMDDDIARFGESMQANATGLFYLIRETANRMVKRNIGSIINISSIHGVVGVDMNIYEGTTKSGPMPDYYFHKAGIINLTRTLASYYGKEGVRVNCISPGGKFNHQESPFLKNYTDRTFLGRMADHDDIKGIIVFLASNASKYITGEKIMVDGGYVQK